MRLQVVRFLSLLLTSVTLSAGLAHLFALPNKIHLSREDYLVAQQIYRGWALLGIVMFAALLLTLSLTVAVRRLPKVFPLTLTALVCMAASLVVFFVFTYPANEMTQNWTVLPDGWRALRAQWEYSHAAGAGLSLVAMAALIWSVLLGHDAAPIMKNDQTKA